MDHPVLERTFRPKEDEAERVFDHLRKKHPCLGEAHGTTGRVHLPVAPGCNIQCGFCRRAFNGEDIRPGLASRLVAPNEAVDFVTRALELCPAIAVVGVAGPGDTLATGHALEAFGRIHERFPDLILCMSTNGLVLGRAILRILDAGVSTLTVTVNGSKPDIVSRIVSWVADDGRIFRGKEGATLLIRRQLEGIARAAEAGLTVKVNMVLIPGVNDEDVGAVAAAVSGAGARLFNVIPLIPQGIFRDTISPDCEALRQARDDAERSLPVFRHCSHCRADACGIPGLSDFSKELYGGVLSASQTFSHG